MCLHLLKRQDPGMWLCWEAGRSSTKPTTIWPVTCEHGIQEIHRNKHLALLFTTVWRALLDTPYEQKWFCLPTGVVVGTRNKLITICAQGWLAEVWDKFQNKCIKHLCMCLFLEQRHCGWKNSYYAMQGRNCGSLEGSRKDENAKYAHQLKWNRECLTKKKETPPDWKT